MGRRRVRNGATLLEGNFFWFWCLGFITCYCMHIFMFPADCTFSFCVVYVVFLFLFWQESVMKLHYIVMIEVNLFLFSFCIFTKFRFKDTLAYSFIHSFMN